MDCTSCSDQIVCEAQNKLDMERLNDVLLALERFDWNDAKDKIQKFKKTLIIRNERITGR